MTVHDSACLMGVPPFIVGPQSTVYLSLLSTLPALCQTKHWGPEIVSLPKTFVFHSLAFSLSVKRRCLQVSCQGRPRGSLAGCGELRACLGTGEPRRARQRVTLML